MEVENLTYNQRYYLKNRDRILNMKAQQRNGGRRKDEEDWAFNYVFKKCYSVRIRHKKKKSLEEMIDEQEKMNILRKKLGLKS